MARVLVPSLLRDLCGGVARLEVAADTLDALLRALDTRCPGFYARVVEGGLAEIDAGLAASPDHPSLHYHRACMLVRLGRLEEAQTHLDRAIEIDDFFAGHARTDEDLAALRVSGKP